MHLNLIATFLAETPWWVGALVATFMVCSWLYSTWIEYQAKKQEEAELEAKKKAAAMNPKPTGPGPAAWQTVVINKDLADALGRRGQGDVVHLPTPPPRRRIEPSPLHTPPARRSPPPPPLSSQPAPTLIPSSQPEPAFPGAGSQAGSATDALSRSAGPATTSSRQSQGSGSTSGEAQPGLMLTELDRLKAQNAKQTQFAQQFGAQRTASGAATSPAPAAMPVSASPTGRGLAALLRDKNAVRQAFILKEVLGTPRGMSSDLY